MESKEIYSISKETGLLNGIEFIASPNFNERPDNTIVDLLVIHNISLPPGTFTGDAVKDFFLNKLNFSDHDFYQQLVCLKVSAHLFIRRDGSMIQFVPFHLRAWHAGESTFQDRKGCNDFSIGIEVEGTDNIPYTNTQYQQLAQVTLQLMKSYPAISLERIVGHQAIAPERKTDPGPAFDWAYFHKLLKGSDS